MRIINLCYFEHCIFDCYLPVISYSAAFVIFNAIHDAISWHSAPGIGCYGRTIFIISYCMLCIFDKWILILLISCCLLK